MADVKPIPDGYSTVIPYISVKRASDAIAFYKKAFGAEEVLRMSMPDGKVGHAELKIGGSIVMLADEMNHPDAIAKSPGTLEGVTSSLSLYVEDCDALFNQAVAAGAKVRRPLTNQFYGDRNGILEDPFGHIWTVSTHVEDVPPDELKRRMDALAPKPPARAPSIFEVNYQEFLGIFRRATDLKKKIDPADKERWNKFVREHDIPEDGLMVKGKAGTMSGKIKLVIVDGFGKADGYYLYSTDDKFCLKYDLGRD